MMATPKQEERLRWWAALLRFDLAGLDAWLATLPPDARRQFAARRQRAAEATTDEAARQHLEAILNGARMYRMEAALLPRAQRDDARQAGTRKRRRAGIDVWIASELRRNPSATRPELWARAPEWITDQIGRDRFLKRVSAARKSGRE